MNEDKFKTLIDNFSPSLLAETFQRSHDFFRIKQNLLPTFSDKQFTDFSQLGDFELEDNTSVVVICARSLNHLNERASRKSQYDISKKILKNFLKSRAGIFIYHDSNGDFRISLIYADYLGVKVNYSTFRRFTYFVSKEQTNTTFFQQVAPFDFKNFQELKEIFSVEKVTKEFFKKYRDLFGDLLEDFDNNKVFKEVVIDAEITNTADFVKKLMGQIVFLYFVQKKGWLGVRPNENWGTGNQTFLRFLFSTCAKANKNYYNDYLEPLFYDALAEKRDKDYFELFNCRIPFLNGGLFESVYDWKKTDINIPNKTTGKLLDFFDQYNFTVDENTPSDQEISIDPEMLGKIFENLLDVKDRKDKGAFYTPREIVHYMCRESLIQHLVSENTAPEERIRKLFEIKDTDLSLLVEDEKRLEMIKRLPELKEISEKVDFSLRNIKIVDPAVGSGAFPMGMLNEISSIRYYLNTNFLRTKNKQGKELTLYDIKKETLENCIYAVDIDPGAVEIAKLRFWLALIVEYNADELENSPPTLPNLDYKIMQGNSLLEEYEGIKLFDEEILQSPIINAEILDPKNQHITKLQTELLQFYMKNPNWMQKGIHKDKPNEVIELETHLRDFLKQNKKIKEDSTEQKDLFTTTAESKKIWETIKSKHKLLFSESNKEEKQDLRRQIEDLNWQLIESTLEEQGKSLEIEKLKELRKSKIKPFFLWRMHFAEVFEEKGGFDVVIGNPPYVGEKGNKEIFQQIAKGNLKEFYQGMMDLFYFFFHIALNYMREGGVMAYITTNYYITATGGVNLRKDMQQRSSILKLLNFGELKIFESALGQHNMITMLMKGKKDIKAQTLVTHRRGYLGSDTVQSIINGTDEETNYYSLAQAELYSGDNIKLTTGGLDNILDKIKRIGIILGDISNVNVGLYTGADKVSKNYINKYKLNAKAGEGIFVLNRKEIQEKNFNNEEIALCVPMFKNSDISPYRTEQNNNKFLIDFSYPNYKDYPLDKYPNIINHLLKYKLVLENRQSNDNGLRAVVKQGFWWLFTKRKLDFDQEKIVAPQRSRTNTFGYNNIPWYASADVYFITNPKDGYNLKYLLGILNSHMVYIWLYNRGKRKGEMLELYREPLSLIPIPHITQKNVNQVKELEKLVDQVLVIKKQNKDADTKNIEHQIDELVYKLYDLTPEETEIVENSSKK